MDKTININLAGTLFQTDEEAFRILRDYLQAINNRFGNVRGGLETIEDIESRIAEIFLSQKGLAGVITRFNVEAMISIIGKPEDFDHIEGESDSPIYSGQRKRMYRNPDDSIISGVCGGIGAYLNTDPVLFRILFILFTLFFGVGFFVYIALWIALPYANTETRKKEMYGNANISAWSHGRQSGRNNPTGTPVYTPGYNNTPGVGNAINEVFRAIGRVFYIALRIFLIITGVAFVLTGFLAILCFVMVFIFHYPGAFSTDVFGMHMIYLPDFLNYIVNPEVAPWIIALTLIALALPMLAMIYWGVKMIFWFKARDGVLSLVGLVLWVMTISALAIILFNEGISFAETAKSSTQSILSHSPDILYIKADNKVSDLKFDKELSIKEKGYTVYINEEKKELYIRPFLSINSSDDNVTRLDVRRGSSGRTGLDARKRSEELVFNCGFKGDTLLLDEYFTIPAGRKWSADNVDINLYIPEGTILKFDKTSENLFHTPSDGESEEDHTSARGEYGNRSWIFTDEGLKALSKHKDKQK